MATRNYDLVETAKLIRTALKEAFPDTKFSVTTRRFAGGTALDVRYTDGPLSKDVNAICKAFDSYESDPYADLSRPCPARLFKGEIAGFGAKYIHVNRRESEVLLQIVAYRVHKETQLPLLEVRDGWVQDGQYQVPFTYFSKEDVIAGGVSQRVAGGEWYSQLVNQVASNTPTPHKTGKTEIPEIVNRLLETTPSEAARTN